MAALLCATAQAAQALVVFGFENNDSVITSHPAAVMNPLFSTTAFDSFPFDSVGHVAGSDFSSPGGSAVHLGGGWMLTADHVATGGNRGVHFTGTGFHTIDTSFTPLQFGTADLKLFRLNSTPNVNSAQVFEQPNVFSSSGFNVGWGRGRASSTTVGTNSVPWSNSNDTIAHRWGFNGPAALQTGNTYDFIANTTYTQTALITIPGVRAAEDPLRDYEAGLTIYDSGSGYFQFIDGQWWLMAIAFSVEVGGTTTFGTTNPNDPKPPRGDYNFYVYLPEYSDEILSAIPEPAAAAVLLALGTLAFTARRRRR